MDRPKGRFRRSFIRGHCLACGRAVFRVARTEVKWCSDACRKAASRACPGDLRPALPAVRSGVCNHLNSLTENGQKPGSSLPIDLIGGWFAGHPESRRTILRIESRLTCDRDDGGVLSRFEPRLASIDREIWDGLGIPDFLRRSPPEFEGAGCEAA